MFLSCIVFDTNIQCGAYNGHVLEIWFMGSFKLASLAHRPYMTYYRSATVSIVLFCTIYEIFDVEEYSDLKI